MTEIKTFSPDEWDQLDDIIFQLRYRDHHQDASVLISGRQLLGLMLAILVIVAAFWLNSELALVMLALLVSCFFAVNITFYLIVTLVGITGGVREPISSEELEALKDTELPSYSILVPVYHEAEAIEPLLSNLRWLDYPQEKLQILVLLEEDDQETLEAALAARSADNVTLVIVPDGQPKTKPRACNVGLFLAEGEYLTIYDAEDRPEVDQLKKAVIALQKGAPDLFCVQATLTFFNTYDNFLTRMFTLEYFRWFNFVLMGLSRLNKPTPLGGTSTHFRSSILRELGGWDPFNVTEDLDLGIRAAMQGYRVELLDSVTYEEANGLLWNWIRQRSRWFKGYMQTGLVRLRKPSEMIESVGWGGTAAAILLIMGTVLTYMLAPFWLATLLLAALSRLDVSFPPIIGYISLYNLVLGNSLAICLNLMAVRHSHHGRLILYAFLEQIYWILHTTAAYRAFLQLCIRPFYWEKTIHTRSVYLFDKSGKS